LKGSLVVKDTKGEGITYGLRLTVNGERVYLRLGSEAEGYTRGKAEAAARSEVALIKAGKWEHPERRVSQKAKRNSPDAARAYSLIRKALQDIDGVRDSTPSADVRLASKRAVDALYVAEDAVTRAIRAA
jgi:hypothetical protein